MLIVGIAGGSGSGKTTVVKRIMERLPGEGVAVLPQDAYYRDNSHLDPEERQKINFDHPDSLEFDLLAALGSEPGRVFSRRQLLERVWGWDFFGDERVVDVHIRNLRKALGDDAARPTIIGTVRGVEVRLEREFRGDFGARVSYTLQAAEATASDAFDFFRRLRISPGTSSHATFPRLSPKWILRPSTGSARKIPQR